MGTRFDATTVLGDGFFDCFFFFFRSRGFRSPTHDYDGDDDGLFIFLSWG